MKTILKLASAMAIVGAGMAQAKTELRLATLAPENTPWYAYIAEWEKAVEDASNGEIDIQIFGGGQLGNELDTWGQVERGRIDIGVFSAAVMAEKRPVMALMSTPMLFDKIETAWCVLDGPMKADLEAQFSDTMHMVTWAENGWVNIYGQDDLSDVATASGYKARVAPHPMSRLVWDSVGANGAELPYAETPAALQTGLVKAGESATVSYFAFGLAKVAPHFMYSRHMHQAGSIMIGQKVWNRLSEEERKILTEATPDVNSLRKALVGMEQYLLGELEKGGVNIHRLSDEQRAAWKAKIEPNWPAFVASLGAEAEALWPKLLEQRAACGE